MIRKGVVLLAVLVLCFSIVYAQTEDGFKGVKWGTHIDKVKTKFALKFRLIDDDEHTYSTNVKTVGGAKVRSCTFGFFQKRFSSVLVKTKDIDESRKLRASLNEAYGEGFQSNKYIETYVWTRVGGGDTNIVYDEALDGSATVLFCSHLMQEEKKEHQAERAKQGVDDL